MSKEVIATDIDEVLFPFVAEFAGWHNQEYGTDLSFGDFKSYEFQEVIGVSIPETVHRVHSFLSVDHGHATVSPLEKSQEAVATLGEDYRLAAVTARHPQFEDPTLHYILQYYQGQITDLTLVGHKETLETVRTKAEVCLEIGAIALIDDSVQHVVGCVEAGVEGLLFGDYPWNQIEELPKGVVRCPNWSGVLEHFGVREQ